MSERKIPLMLALDAGGSPTRWITYKDAAYYISKDLVQWALGEHEFTIYGGHNHEGVQSSLTMNTIFAIKGHVQAQHMLRTGKYSPPLDNKQLFARDEYLCGYCNKEFEYKDLTRDHIVPKRMDGPNTWKNCVTACRRCNHHKGDKMLSRCGMTLSIEPYTPCKAEYLILKNKNLLQDQHDYLLKHIKNEKSRFYNKKDI